MVARFRREGVASSKLTHHASVKVFNFGETDEGVLWLAMEFLDGKTLDVYLREKNKLPTKELLAILRPICELLEEAHSKGIVHRDLKPENIMILREPQLTPKILDFGLASLLESDDKATQTGMVSGTPRYMSPEQWKGLKYTDHRADLYALGVIVYQCLSGRLPFDADTGPAWMQKHCLDEPIDLEVASSYSVTPAVKSAVAKSLLKEPDHRYQSAMEFYRAIEAAVEKNAAVTMVQSKAGPAPKPVASSAISGNVTMPTLQPAPPKGLSLKLSLGKFQIAFSLAFVLLAGVVIMPLLQDPGFTPTVAEQSPLLGGLTNTDDAIALNSAAIVPASAPIKPIGIADTQDKTTPTEEPPPSNVKPNKTNTGKTSKVKEEPQAPVIKEPEPDPVSDKPNDPTLAIIPKNDPTKAPTADPAIVDHTAAIEAIKADVKTRIYNIAKKCSGGKKPGYKGKLTFSSAGSVTRVEFTATAALLKETVEQCAKKEIFSLKIKPTPDGKDLSFSF
jgi:serine/threonine protein kinase